MDVPLAICRVMYLSIFHVLGGFVFPAVQDTALWAIGLVVVMPGPTPHSDRIWPL